MQTRLTVEMPESAIRRLLDGYRQGDPALMHILKKFKIIGIKSDAQDAISVWENEGGRTAECEEIVHMTNAVSSPHDICSNCRRPVTKHRPWCKDVRTSEPPKLGDMVDHPLLGQVPVISIYSRQEAIDDGTLVDCTQEPFDELTREAGVIFDVAMTRAAFERYVEVPKGCDAWQEIKGRYWDIIRMFVYAARRHPNADDILFEFVCIPSGTDHLSNERRIDSVHRLVRLKALAHPGDRGEPCLTMMLPDED
jgi:hypothetical protein